MDDLLINAPTEVFLSAGVLFVVVIVVCMFLFRLLTFVLRLRLLKKITVAFEKGSLGFRKFITDIRHEIFID